MNTKEIARNLMPSFLLSFYHYLLVVIATFVYSFPSKKIKVIGVTGTSGKTTVVNLTTGILEEAGYKTACISSIKFKIGDKEWENKLKMTMPGRFKLQKFLKQAVEQRCEYVVLEVTSEGIKQHRHRFIDFEAVIFTNLSLEHIEAHKGFENYRKAKLDLFKKTKNIHIINIDDKNSRYFLDIPSKIKYSFGIKSEAKVKAEEIEIKSDYSLFKIDNLLFKISLIGEFNVYNALASVSVGLSQNISLEVCKTALEKSSIPGRMEIITKEPFTVVVDYAHTPESLEKVYKTFKHNALICVLGSCGGGRDKWKRPVLGKLAEKYCKDIIITNEDPYDEDPMKIIEQVAKGVKGAQKILDRKQAIKKAIELANPNDTVIITGKGSEPWMCVKGGKKIAWDDREIVKQELKKA